jgi:hypothetical protein
MTLPDAAATEEPNEGTDDDMTHDEERTPEPISTSTPKSQDYYSSRSNSVCSYIDTSNMEIMCPPTVRDVDHVYADMTKKQIREEIFEMKNRIKWLEDRAMKQHAVPTDLIKETSSTPTSSQGHQNVFFQPLQQDNSSMTPSLHPVLSQQNVWEAWNKSRCEQMHQAITSMNDDSDNDPHAHENKQEDEGWDQLHKDNDEFDTPGQSSEEDDLATILDLPPAKTKRRDIMDESNEAASTMTEINMSGDCIIMHEIAIAVNEQELHTDKENTFAKMKLLADDNHSYDEKHVNTIQHTRPPVK